MLGDTTLLTVRSLQATTGPPCAQTLLAMLNVAIDDNASLRYLTSLLSKLSLILSPWHFMKSGMNIIGKLPTAPGQRVYMLVVTDYFTK